MLIAAAAVVPLTILGGSAVDIGRIYLVKSRLQHACDAGALAYRGSMNGSNVTATTLPTAQSFFNANFEDGRYGSGTPSITFTVDAQVVVHGAASVSVPMLVMGGFGASAFNASVTCDAQMQLPNTDVMFVLDTTGSMTATNPGDSVSKIAALRTAVINFYSTLQAAKVSGTQVRYGFVPYSNTVNVGMLLKREWMVDSATYQSRVFDHQESSIGGYSSAYSDTMTGWTPGPVSSYYAGVAEACVAPANTGAVVSQSSTAWSPSATAVPRTRNWTRTTTGANYSASTLSDGSCRINKSDYTGLTQTSVETYAVNPSGGTPWYNTYNYWTYRPVTFDVSGLKGTNANGLMAGGSLSLPLNNPATNVTTPPTAAANTTITWNASRACIEERKTLRSGESGTAYDMDIDMVPTTDPDTRWRPFLPYTVYARGLTYYPASNSSTWPWVYDSQLTANGYVSLGSFAYDHAACPSPARKLDGALTLAALTTYINGLSTGGDTYHDIGFLWGLRLASAQGLFASENATAPNGFDISRNIVFMTDGDTDSRIEDYDAYGLSALDRRRTSTASLPTDAAQNTIVETRLQTYCDAAKAKGMTVWVVAFGTSLTSMLQNCASSGRAYQANNASELNTAFADIATRIAQLRLTG